MFEFIDINSINEDRRNRILRNAYEYIPKTYERYFKRYEKGRWPFEKFQTKTKDEYPLAVLNEENEDLILYLVVSNPKEISEINYFKLGFWVFGEKVRKIQKKKILKNSINFLEEKILERYERPILFIEVPSDFTSILKFYKEMEFKICKDINKINLILKNFDRELENIRNWNYITKNTKIYQSLLIKDLYKIL